MNTDIRIEVGFFGHRKTMKLQRVLGDHGVMSLMRLWVYAAVHHPDGDLSGLDDDDIELAATFNGQRGDFVRTLRELGWLDGKTKRLTLHGWVERQPYAASQPDRKSMAEHNSHVRWHVRKGKKLSTCSHCANDAGCMLCAMPPDATGNAGRMEPQCGSHDMAMRVDANRNAPDSDSKPDTLPTLSGAGPIPDRTAAMLPALPAGKRSAPKMSRAQFLVTADRITKWTDEKAGLYVGGHGDGFDRAFRSAFGMSRDEWEAVKAEHQGADA